MTRIFKHLLSTLRRLPADSRGASAVEFAVILPMMLVLFFGTVELSNGVAVDRKVTLTARTMSDIISQATSVTASDIKNSFDASTAIMTPYSASPMRAIISEITIDSSGKPTIAWSCSRNAIAHNPTDPVPTLPSALAVPGAYLIWSQASYTYTPVVGYVMKTALTLGDQFFTRPRQSPDVPLTTSCPS